MLTSNSRKVKMISKLSFLSLLLLLLNGCGTTAEQKETNAPSLSGSDSSTYYSPGSDLNTSYLSSSDLGTSYQTHRLFESLSKGGSWIPYQRNKYSKGISVYAIEHNKNTSYFVYPTTNAKKLMSEVLRSPLHFRSMKEVRKYLLERGLSFAFGTEGEITQDLETHRLINIQQDAL
ncbi:MAG: hypothetical protein LBS59_08245 [Puniceicoccales bacterium]|nr:hypothetical protein [Puniceicoccales bacterium]